MGARTVKRLASPGRRGRAALGVCASLLCAPGAVPASADWPIYGHDLSNSRVAVSAGPAPAQVGALRRAWAFSSPSGDFTGTPVVARGVVVAGDYSGVVYALDARTGRVRWKTDLGRHINGSAAIDPRAGRVYVPLATVGSPGLAALSLRDGRLRWSRVLTRQAGSDAYSSPVYWRGRVYMETSGPTGDDSTARGTVVALNARSGAVRWRTFMVPRGHDGGGVWSTPAIDTATGRLYVGTGNAYHAPDSQNTDSIVALDARTGAIRGHFQALKGDTFASDNPAGPDADFGASPNFFRAPDGRRLVGEGAKDGVYYTVDRRTMRLRWKTAIGPGSPTGGILGSTVSDGQRVYGSDSITGQVAAIGTDGSIKWSSVDGGPLDFSPLAMAHGVLYSVTPAGILNARDPATGGVLTRVSLGAPTVGGISAAGRALYVSIGIGPPPPPAPQEYGPGSIVALTAASR